MIEALIILVLLAFLMELIDSSLGMMYGTILSPLMIAMGYAPLVVVPAVLISQAIGGILGTISHHRFKNANFHGLTRDTKVVLAVVLPGIIAVLFGFFVAVEIPKEILRNYIGLLAIIFGILCIFPIRYAFSWWKIYSIGIVASFNKAISGGGFGPLTSTGKVLGGLDSKVSVATTTYAEVPICILSFLLYLFVKGGVDAQICIALCIGSAVGGLIGPYITKRVNTHWFRIVVGGLAVLVGFLCIFAKLGA
jgi:uncharacterized protein